MYPSFHLSIAVKSIEDSLDFFGSQITLKHQPDIEVDHPHFHFGANLSLKEFDRLAENILENGRNYISMEPKVMDIGTPLERKKMYLNCPTGYLVELKGYK